MTYTFFYISELIITIIIIIIIIIDRYIHVSKKYYRIGVLVLQYQKERKKEIGIKEKK